MYVRCNEHAAIDRASLWIFLFQEKLLGQLARVFGRKCVFSAAIAVFCRSVRLRQLKLPRRRSS
jgi:hypothetical protein